MYEQDEKSVETFQQKAPLLDLEEFSSIIADEVFTEEMRERAREVWVISSFAIPDKEIDSGEYRSDIDLYVVVPEWDLPVTDTGAALVAPQASTPDAYVKNSEEYEWSTTPRGDSKWDCSIEEVWETLPEYAQETLIRSTEKLFHASPEDMKSEQPRPLDINIGSPWHWEYDMDPSNWDVDEVWAFKLWSADEDKPWEI